MIVQTCAVFDQSDQRDQFTRKMLVDTLSRIGGPGINLDRLWLNGSPLTPGVVDSTTILLQQILRQYESPGRDIEGIDESQERHDIRFCLDALARIRSVMGPARTVQV